MMDFNVDDQVPSSPLQIPELRVDDSFIEGPSNEDVGTIQSSETNDVEMEDTPRIFVHWPAGNQSVPAYAASGMNEDTAHYIAVAMHLAQLPIPAQLNDPRLYHAAVSLSTSAISAVTGFRNGGIELLRRRNDDDQE